MRKYETRGWLWCLSSLTVFLALGAYPLFDVKGAKASLASGLVNFARELLIARNAAELIPTLVLALAWASCAAGLGWVLQALILVAFHRGDDKTESSI